MGLKDFENLKVGALPVSGWAPPSVGWGWGGRRLVSGFILIDSKPHVFQRILPSKQTFSEFTNPYYRVDFSWILTSLSVCKTFSSPTEVFLQFYFKVANPRRLEEEFQRVFTDALSLKGWGGSQRDGCQGGYTFLTGSSELP